MGPDASQRVKKDCHKSGGLWCLPTSEGYRCDGMYVCINLEEIGTFQTTIQKYTKYKNMLNICYN